LGLAVAAIAFATLRPQYGTIAGTDPFCLICGTRGSADFWVNILLFVPLGVAVAWLGVAAKPAFLLGAATALGIELLQTLLPGRSPTALDILSNAIGTWLGATVALNLRAWTAPGARAGRHLLLVALCAFLAVGTTGWFWTPLHGQRFWAQWQHEFANIPAWTGRIHRATLGTIDVPDGRLPQSLPVKQLLLDDSALTLTLTSAPHPPTVRTSVFGLAIGGGRYAVELLQEGQDLILNAGRIATLLAFSTPQHRFRGAARYLGAHEPVELAITHAVIAAPCLTIADYTECVLAPSIGSGWRLLYDLDAAGPLLRRLLDATTLILLAVPFGLLLPATQSRVARGVAVVFLLVLPVWGCALDLAPPSLLDVAALLMGLGLGAAWWCFLHAPRSTV